MQPKGSPLSWAANCDLLTISIGNQVRECNSFTEWVNEYKDFILVTTNDIPEHL